MKTLLKNRKAVMIISAVLALLLIVGIVFCLTRPKKNNKTEISETTVTDEQKEVNVEVPSESDAETSDTAVEIEDDGNAISPDENISPSSADNSISPAEPAAEAKYEADYSKPAEYNSPGGGVQIGEGYTEETYSCGCANHRCNSPETHAYILNLELEGCPYCGSHSCPSFYGTDEWGNAGYYPTLCPSYSEANDPLHTCQSCGKPVGDGSGGSCAIFVNSCYCPLCGEYTEAGACHSCK